MSQYIILMQPEGNKDIRDIRDILSLSSHQKLCFILPKNLMTYYDQNGLFEASLIEWSKQFCKQDKITLDIGAHTGTYGISLSSSSKEVYCFEPQQMTYYALCGSVALSNLQNVICKQIGLGSTEQVGKNTLKIVSDDGGGSSLHAKTFLKEEEITILTLDSLSLNNIGFIKIDVEDNEEHVIRGAIETLRRSSLPPILFECNNKANHPGLFEILSEIGYKIVQVSGVQNMYLAST
jgi:FkbM family methyltransferase